MTLYLNEQELGQLIDMPMALRAVEAAHLAHARGEAADIARRRVRGSPAMQHLMQASWPSAGLMGFKVYTTSASGARFWLHLFDAATGAPLAVLEADLLGMMRTGAASGLAARCLSRPDARVAGIIGAGWQARGQMRALMAVRHLERFQIYARSADKLTAFCEEMARELGVPVEPAATAEAAVRGADIVVTITTSAKPVLEADWLEKGVHINAAGSNSLLRRELDEKTLAAASVLCVDSRENASLECGDLLPLFEKGRVTGRMLPELGELLAGFRPGRTAADELTVFESQGMAVQDLALGAEVLQRARLAGLGRDLPY